MLATSLLVPGKWLVYVTGLLALGAIVGVNHARAQAPDPSLKPRHGTLTLKHGFKPDPYAKDVSAGGSIKTELGGVNARVGHAPDVKFHFTAEVLLVDMLPAPLRIYVQSKKDTTLLVKLPDGTWVANDDGGGGRNPQLRFGRPQTGWYSIWVGTYGHAADPTGTAATLYISERPPGKKLPK